MFYYLIIDNKLLKLILDFGKRAKFLNMIEEPQGKAIVSTFGVSKADCRMPIKWLFAHHFGRRRRRRLRRDSTVDTRVAREDNLWMEFAARIK